MMLSRRFCRKILPTGLAPSISSQRPSLALQAATCPKCYFTQPVHSQLIRRIASTARPALSIRRFLPTPWTFETLNFAAPMPKSRNVGGRRRSFSSRNRRINDKSSDFLVNETLLAELRKRFPNAGGPNEMEVRLVIDEGPDQPSTVQVCSLAEAIEVSLDRMTDLIGVGLQNDPPVIRAAQLSKLEYQKEQASAKHKSAAKTKQKKEFRFRAGIDLHDLARKIQDMEKFLEKGTECEYTVFAKARMLRENATAGKELVDRIQELLSHCAVQKAAPQTNETGNLIRVRLMPKKS